MSYRGSPLSLPDYIRYMDTQIREIRALMGTARIPSQRIGEYIVEIVEVGDNPLIKLTEVATGEVTFCCQPDIAGENDCPEIPPFTWYGLVDSAATFPGYPVPIEMTIVEAVVVQTVGSSALTIELHVNENYAGQFITDPLAYVQRYNVGPQILYVNDVVTLRVADVGDGDAENVVIVLRTCPTPTLPVPEA